MLIPIFYLVLENNISIRTALRLSEYEDILDTKDIYSLIALTSFYNKYFAQCSKAFVKLEALEDVPSQEQKAYSDLALTIFSTNPPTDPGNRVLVDHSLSFCVATGKTISADARFWM